MPASISGHIILGRTNQSCCCLLHYLSPFQQVGGQSQPIRTAGLQLQSDECQSQHRASELQKDVRDKMMMKKSKTKNYRHHLNYFQGDRNVASAENKKQMKELQKTNLWILSQSQKQKNIVLYLYKSVVCQTVVESLCDQSQVLRTVYSQHSIQKPRTTRWHRSMKLRDSERNWSESWTIHWPCVWANTQTYDVQEIQSCGCEQTPAQFVQNNPLHPQDLWWRTTTTTGGSQLLQGGNTLMEGRKREGKSKRAGGVKGWGRGTWWLN